MSKKVMVLKEVLKEFVLLFGRDGTDIGSIIFNETVEITHEGLDDFYRLTSFDHVLTVGGELFINISPGNRLDKAQEGFYKIKKNGEWVNDNERWKKEWIVFANRNDDPVFFNTENGSVHGSVDKKEFFVLSSSLSNFFQIISQCMCMEQYKYNFDTSDEDEETVDNFEEDVYNIIVNIEDEKTAKDFMDFFFEY